MYEIYITTNLLNGKRYIGQHKLTKQYDYYLGSGLLLKQAIEKYGIENFKKEMLCQCESKEEANELERYYIQKYNAVEDPNFYNIAAGGDGGGFEYYAEYLKTHPEEAARITQSRIDGVRKWQNENKEKVSELGKENIKKCHQWQKEHPEVVKNNGNPEALKKWAEEHPEEALKNRQKGAEALVKWNKEHQEQSRANLALGPQANKEKNGKKIVCVNTGQVFNSIHEAEAYFGTYKDAIGRCLRGQLNTAGKDPVTGKRLKWKYLDASEE